MSKLKGTAPVTLTFNGPYHWDRDTPLGNPADITLTWKYTLTFQRVDANGDPL